MSELSITRKYSQSPSEVFAALNDFAGIHRFHPLLTSSPLVEGTPASGAGSERVCHLHDGNTLHERLVDSKPDEWLKIEVVDSSMPVAKMAGRFDLKPTPEGGTEVTMTSDFDLKMGLLGKLLDKLVVGRKFRGNLELLLSSLGTYMDTGKDVPKAWKGAAA